MPRNTITPAHLTQVANMLAENNNQFRARVNDLMNAAQELAAMWQGDANNTFNNALNNDQERWVAFAALVDTYVETLRRIIETWHEVEGENIGIASRRTY